jgi:hypothetical protein
VAHKDTGWQFCTDTNWLFSLHFQPLTLRFIGFVDNLTEILKKYENRPPTTMLVVEEKNFFNFFFPFPSRYPAYLATASAPEIDSRIDPASTLETVGGLKKKKFKYLLNGPTVQLRLLVCQSCA